jgi:hypothetical protein
MAEKPKRNPRDRKAPVVERKAGDKPAPKARRDRPGRDGARDEGPKFVGGPRNEHGTRIARRVTCMRCGTHDHVPFVPKDPAMALCRNCAAEVLKTYEAGVKVRMPTRMTKCNLCGTPFALPITAEDDGDPLCPSCLKGFTSWQGSVDTPFEVRSDVVVEERLSGALVRKRKKSE